MKSMVILLILNIFAFSSCKLNTQNSNSADKQLVQDSCSSLTESEGRFCRSQNIIKNRCVSCHTGYHNAYADYDERDYTDNFLIEPGDANTSTLIQRLFNAGGNMPQGGSSIPDDEYQELIQWANNL